MKRNSSNFRRARTATWLMSTSALLLTQPALAQSTPDANRETTSPVQTSTADNRRMLDSVTVTARKREESLQEVPIAITAFGAEEIREKNIKSYYDVPLHTPGLSVRTASAQRNSPDFFIRGQGSTFGTPPGVVSYFADAPTGASATTSLLGANIQFYDLASVQVLKGPQGTLFGRSTTGGAVLVDPKRPSFEQDGQVEVRAGDYNMREVTAAFNVPLIDDVLALRLAGNVVRRDGFTTSYTTGQQLDDRHRDSYRLGVVFNPTEWLNTYTLFYGQKVDEAASGSVLLEYNENHPLFNTTPNAGTGWFAVAGLCGAISPTPEAAGACIAERTGRLDALAGALLAEETRVRNGGNDAVRYTATAFDNFAVGRLETLQNEAIFKLGNLGFLGDVSLKNIYATSRMKRAASTREISGSSLPHGQPINGQDLVNGVPTITDHSGTVDFFKTYSEEIQLQGDGEVVDWIVGYFEEQNASDIIYPPIFPSFNNAFTVPLDTLAPLSKFVIDNKTRDTGFFGQATVNLDALVEGLQFTAGYRRSKSTREQKQANAIPTADGLVAMNIGPGPELNDSASSYNLTVDYQVTPELLLYAAHRTGFKGGGINTPVEGADQIPGIRQIYDPETVKDVEFGAKYEWEAGPVVGRSNIAIFKQWYDDIQRTEQIANPNPPFGTVTQTNNIAAAEIQGLEFDALAQIGDKWRVTLTYAYTDAEYTEYPGTDTDFLGNVVNLIDSPYVGTPEHQGTLGVSYLAYSAPEFGDVSISGNFYRQTKVYLDDQGYKDPSSWGEIDGYTMINARLDWANVFNHPVDAALFVTNLTDETHPISISSLVEDLGTMTAIYNEPRMVGAELRYRFN